MKRKLPHDNLGDILLELGVITTTDLQEALGRQGGGDHRPLGVILIALGHTSAGDIEYALMRQKARRGEMDGAAGVQLLEQAVQCTRNAATSMEELTLVTQQLVTKAKG